MKPEEIAAEANEGSMSAYSMTTLDDYVAWPWRPVAAQLPEGDWQLTVGGLDEFAVYAATEQDAWNLYPEMLRAYLNAYVHRGMKPPFPVWPAT